MTGECGKGLSAEGKVPGMPTRLPALPPEYNHGSGMEFKDRHDTVMFLDYETLAAMHSLKCGKTI